MTALYVNAWHERGTMPVFSPDQLARWTGGAWTRPPAMKIRRMVHDSRVIRPGDLFVAMQGERVDGHRFVEEALVAGAAGALVEQRKRHELPVRAPLLAVDDAVRAVQRCAEGHRRTLTRRVIGVTGSVGKTTVKEMIADIMSYRGTVARSPGNWNNHIGLPLSLLTMEPGDTCGVFEIGMNHPGEICALSALLQPDWGVITRIGPVHLEFFESVEDIAREKASMLNALPPDGCAFISEDSPWYDTLLHAAPCRVVTISMEGRNADFRGRPGARATEEMTVQERGLGETHTYTMPLPGRHIMENALLAIAVARTAGLPSERIEGALSVFRPLDMRWSRTDAAGRHFINDAYNANPMSMRAALETFAGIESVGGKWLVLAGMNELGEDERQWHLDIGAAAGKGPWAGIVAVGPKGQWIAQGAAAAGWPEEHLYVCGDARRAAQVLRRVSREGDHILLKASRREHLEEIINNME